MNIYRGVKVPRGEIINLKVYQRIVDDYNVMRKYDAVGLSKEILLDLKSAGIHLIRILRISKVDNTKIYFTTVSAFLASDLKHDYIVGDTNLFMPFSDMLLQNVERQSNFKEVLKRG